MQKVLKYNAIYTRLNWKIGVLINREKKRKSRYV